MVKATNDRNKVSRRRDSIVLCMKFKRNLSVSQKLTNHTAHVRSGSRPLILTNFMTPINDLKVPIRMFFDVTMVFYDTSRNRLQEK